MNARNLMVTFVLALFLVAGASMVSAASSLSTSNYSVKVNGINAMGSNGNVSVVAGSTMTVEVTFTAPQNDTDVTFEATLEGNKAKTFASSSVFDVESGYQYTKTLTLSVPSELNNELSDGLTLSLSINGRDYKYDLNDVSLRVQRPSYDAVVKSITTPTTIDAGQTIPVEIVVKNMGYNKLNDLYVSAGISDLNIVQGPKWFGDLTSLDNCTNDCNQQDTVVGNMYLTMPYSVKPGVYTLKVVVQNGDTQTVAQKQITVKNDLPSNVISTTETKDVKKGESASFNLLLVNPTNNVKVYTLVANSSNVDTTFSQSVVAVPAGSSKTVTVSASSQNEGSQAFNVNVFSNNNLEKTVAYKLNVQGNQTSAVLILTIVLAAIFLVLLVALIVLLGRKPEKAEDLGESYY